MGGFFTKTWGEFSFQINWTWCLLHCVGVEFLEVRGIICRQAGCSFHRLQVELTVNLHESLTCLTVGGQDTVRVTASIWTEGGKSSLEKTMRWTMMNTHTRTHTHTHTPILYVGHVHILSMNDEALLLSSLKWFFKREFHTSEFGDFFKLSGSLSTQL